MPEMILSKLRGGEPLGDRDFDRLLPAWARKLSRVHWTPVEVARRAVELLVTRPEMRVLDVGAGVGKFCVVGALASPASFHGVEQRRRFVDVARGLAEALGVKNARFLHGNMMGVDWQSYDGFYLFNPFAEQLHTVDPIDAEFAAGREHYWSHVRFVTERLERVREGTRVVTYHGFGDDLPAAYRLEHVEPAHTDRLELWVKAA
jgi:SAM-dependent methyltransferase